MTSTPDHTTLSKSILKTLLYFDIFQYPLTASEIFKHLPTNHVTPDHVNEELVKLSSHSIIFPIQDFFSVQDSPALGSRRIKGNRLAAESLFLAKKQARLIARFPFVRSVMASGSLSKDYMDESSDLDFFVITKPNRLWVCRMLLVVYKKFFLFNSHKYFCTNYFLDEYHLEIEEKNIFTATELSTLIPLCGKDYYEKLILANNWVTNYLPNFTSRSTDSISNFESNWFTKGLEFFFNLIGDRLEKLCLKLIYSRWKNRYEKSFSATDFQIAFKTKKYVSKGHPGNHQQKVLQLYEQKLTEFGNKLNINWNE